MVVSFTIAQMFHVLALMVALMLTGIGVASLVPTKGIDKDKIAFLFIMDVILLASPIFGLLQ